ncbi:MAG TPA: branched-chain amino acid ABC transporter substrate-binding protein [Microvirga sp.]|nr:branched-chain amino acid ABC transporter substrate-binding protein [Microvirga sp.]
MAGRFRRLLWVLLAVLAVRYSHAASAEILLGVAAPFSGPFEYGGEQWQQGVELAVTELNATGGLLGQVIVLDIVDDYCDAEQAMVAARKLVADKVAAVIGHLCSGAAIPTSELYEEAQIPSLTLATNPLLTGRGLRFVFRPSTPDDAQGAFAADYLVREAGAKRIGILHDTTVYGKGVAEVTRKRLDELGVPAVLVEAIPPGEIVFADVVERLRRAAIEGLYYGGYGRTAALLRMQMAEARFLPVMMVSSGAGAYDYGLIAGPAAEGTLVTGDPVLETPESADFEVRFRAAAGVKSDIRGRTAYRAAMLWAQAVKAAGTTAGPAVADALHSGTFHVSGVEVRFDSKGDAQGPLVANGVWVWHGGELVPLAPKARVGSGHKP